MKRGGVLLVLLMILAAETRLWQHDPPDVAPPAPRTRPASDRPKDADVTLTYSSDRQVALNGKYLPLAALEGTLREMYRVRTDRTLWLEGHGSVPYGEIAALIDIAKRAGVERVGVITPGMRAEQVRERKN